MRDDLHLKLRNLSTKEYEQVKVLMDKVYDDLGGA